MENSGFFPWLREVTNSTNATTADMYDMTSYLYWANMSDIELSFPVTHDQWNQVNITTSKKVYYKFKGYEEETSLAAYNYLQVQYEFTQILLNQIQW
jgi:hypothetical protein